MTENTLSTILGLSALSDRYRGVLCDVWGVVHNGVAAFEPACTALARFREAGGSVVLLTNAPRPSGPIYEQLDDLGVPRAAYDTIVTSGDATRAYLLEKGIAKVLHIGPERDLSFFEGTDIERVGADTAELVICTGLFDDTTETPADYADQLAELKAHGLSFVCANPDIVVERGSELVWCAGALARDYAAIGGDVMIFGKPHAPIYRAALCALEGVAGKPLPHGEILAIGDGLATDIAGAVAQGLPTLFISAGIHAADFGPADDPDIGVIADRLARENLAVIGTMPRLRW